MTIIVIEGLSLTGKSTLCKRLVQHYSSAGIRCRLCCHGHFTDSITANHYYDCAIHSYNKWDIPNAVKWSVRSLQEDYRNFCMAGGLSQAIDVIFLDRHYISQYVVAEHFGIDIRTVFQRPARYFEFLLTTSYTELLRRSAERSDNHSKLTDYTLSKPNIHKDFERLYQKQILTNNPLEHIVNNQRFDALTNLTRLIDKLM